MTIRFYFDENMRRVVAKGLIQRGFEVTMGVDVGMRQKDDDTEHLPYATEHGMVLVAFDRPFAGRTMSKTDHAGLVCIDDKLAEDIGSIIRVLVEFAETHTITDVQGKVFWLK